MKGSDLIKLRVKEAAEKHGLTYEEADELLREAFFLQREIMNLSWIPNFTIPGWGRFTLEPGTLRGRIIRTCKAVRAGKLSREAAKDIIGRYYPLYKVKWEHYLEDKKKRENGSRKKS